MTHLNNGKLVIFVAPLDWGLGHATRCIPIINELLKIGCEIIIGADGKQAALIKLEFPQIKQVPLKGYQLVFGTSRRKTLWKLFLQIPKILTAIKQENRWLAAFTREHRVDLVISDNRFGLWHTAIPCVFITHQLLIKTSFGGFTERFLQRLNYRFINRFTQCWVPDIGGESGLAGELSHPSRLPRTPIQYLGALSRIRKNSAPVKQAPILLILLSGPEPQRTLLENILIKELESVGRSVVFVRGLPETGEPLSPKGKIIFHNHVAAAVMQQLIEQASVVISRPGYSTVMDLLPLGKRAVFIPTPGQAEQEYLARYLASKKYCIVAEQDKVNGANLIMAAEQLTLPDLSYYQNELLLKTAINNVVMKLPGYR